MKFIKCFLKWFFILVALALFLGGGIVIYYLLSPAKPRLGNEAIAYVKKSIGRNPFEEMPWLVPEKVESGGDMFSQWSTITFKNSSKEFNSIPKLTAKLKGTFEARGWACKKSFDDTDIFQINLMPKDSIKIAGCRKKMGKGQYDWDFFNFVTSPDAKNLTAFWRFDSH